MSQKLRAEVSQTQISIDSKEPALKKNFSLWATAAMQFSLICSPMAIGTFLTIVIGIGGSPVLLYGFILAVTFDLIICFSLAELASAYPHSSAQVHWTYVLAPDRYKKLLSFMNGVLSCAGWIFACFSATLIGSMLIIALAQVHNPDYAPTNWHQYLIYAGILIFGYMVNVFSVESLPYITKFLVCVINGGTLFILVSLLVKAHPKRSAAFVFKDIVNQTGWESNGVVFFLGLLPSIACICLYDGAAHMTDEMEHPQSQIPLVMVISNSASAILTLLAIIVYMFCITNVENLNTPFGGQPIVQLMYDSFNSKALTTIGTLCLIIAFVGSCFFYYCSTSRLVWAFSRSHGLPSIFGKVSGRLNSPVNALTFVLVVCLILGCLLFGSATALNAVLGTSMVCSNLSYLVPIACLLWRSKFAVSPHQRYRLDTDDQLCINTETGLPFFHLGRFGVFMNICACFWVCFIMVWLNFPIAYPVTSDNMNYACAVLGCTLIVGVGLWFGYAKKRIRAAEEKAILEGVTSNL
ncbi:amino acid transporter [Suhomyces tanzawaensis NRRL Y-17324]|uniref:Amino acid transporter n=1 Tax=Suhomyces tanzawaensis NRRL Y-17324 TaxID=984487 RepID=A0A1E4SDC6_9ASCO|nr:amino acid transporter [Suhomyces tanzawaensis NRRL Y-17324]ODV77392.1 amino acid transporter [Suhomyces tanzawaensis NRRL Y-17324]